MGRGQITSLWGRSADRVETVPMATAGRFNLRFGCRRCTAGMCAETTRDEFRNSRRIKRLGSDKNEYTADEAESEFQTSPVLDMFQQSRQARELQLQTQKEPCDGSTLSKEFVS